jgi:hypothetical protein
MLRLLRPKRVFFLGLGFLLGSRAGRGPWDKAVALAGEVQGKAQSKLGGGGFGASSNGMPADLRDTSGTMTQL